MALTRSVLRAAGKTTGRPDYIVIGAGSAGCVITNRLITEHGASVCLVEGGGDDRGSWDSWKIQMPSALTFNLEGTKYNWDYWTVPQKGLNNRSLHQPRGKCFGGSSSLNAMAYVRGHALDYERWADVEGAGERWKYKNVLPYFKKAQMHGGEPGVQTPDRHVPSVYRGDKGPLHVTRRKSEPVKLINEAFVKAGIEVGYPESLDHNGYQQEGFGPMDMTVSPQGTRWSTANAYLRPLLRSGIPTLEVKSKRVATRLLFDKDTPVGKAPRAIGVEVVDQNGRLEELYCNEEVILSLGAVGSPVLLNHSGIGDPADLKDLGIPVRVASPEVGKNLQDHLEFYIQYTAKAPISLYPYAATYPGFGPLKYVNRYLFRNPFRAGLAGVQWLLNGSGIASSSHFEVGGFIRSKAGLRSPDIQYHFIPGCVVGQMDFLPQHGYQAHAGTLRPTSRGTIKTTSKDPFATPRIDPNFLDTEEDIIDQRASFRRTMEIMEAKAFNAFREERYSPEPGFDIDNDTDVDNWIRANSHSGYHLSCTCAIGRVVDDEGRVMGVDGLRVADASIMPSMSSGNLNAPTIMLAEKVADMIRGHALPAEDHPWWEPKEGAKQR